MGSDTEDALKSFQALQDAFVGVDSDGCVFDTMGVKQKDFFHPEMVERWGLQRIEDHVRAVAEFVNLYSEWRGMIRFAALLKTFQLLKEWPEVAESGVALPDTTAFEAYVDSGRPIGVSSLKEEADRTGDADLRTALDWSEAVDRNIAEHMQEIPPFRGVRECLEKMRESADLVVVSQTPRHVVAHEWDLHGVSGLIRFIAGPELGTKVEQLQMFQDGRYPGERMLMVGDSPGDRKAAAAVGAFFFPINPGHEVDSWARLYQEAYDRFLEGSFGGAYQQQLIDEFESLLPDTPPWLT